MFKNVRRVSVFAVAIGFDPESDMALLNVDSGRLEAG